MSHQNPSCGLGEKLQQTLFLKMLESALAHFIQNKLYLQYIFIISLYSYILSFFYVILARKADMYKTALNVDNDSGNIFERFPYNLL